MRKERKDKTMLSLAQQGYIETIWELSAERGSVRTVDLAGRMKIRMPSVSEAVSRLADSGLVSRKSRHEIVLTEKGRAVAGTLEKYHTTLRKFMTGVMMLGRDEADQLACRMEHSVDRKFISRLMCLISMLERDYPEALKHFPEHINEK